MFMITLAVFNCMKTEAWYFTAIRRGKILENIPTFIINWIGKALKILKRFGVNYEYRFGTLINHGFNHSVKGKRSYSISQFFAFLLHPPNPFFKWILKSLQKDCLQNFLIKQQIS